MDDLHAKLLYSTDPIAVTLDFFDTTADEVNALGDEDYAYIWGWYWRYCAHSSQDVPTYLEQNPKLKEIFLMGWHDHDGDASIDS